MAGVAGENGGQRAGRFGFVCGARQITKRLNRLRRQSMEQLQPRPGGKAQPSATPQFLQYRHVPRLGRGTRQPQHEILLRVGQRACWRQQNPRQGVKRGIGARPVAKLLTKLRAQFQGIGAGLRRQQTHCCFGPAGRGQGACPQYRAPCDKCWVQRGGRGRRSVEGRARAR